MAEAAAPADLPLTLCAHIEARARDPETGPRPFVLHDDRALSHRDFRDACVRTAHFLLRRLGRRSGSTEEAPRVAMLLENRPELLTLYGGCAYAGATLFGVNTGLRGDTLAGVIDQSRARLLVVEEKFAPEVDRIAGRLRHLGRDEILVVSGRESAVRSERDYLARIEAEVPEHGSTLDPPDVAVRPEDNLLVIYTSGTTGLPKGINNNHLKLLTIGKVVASRLELAPEDVGYACMPLFHSNAIFLGFQPALEAGAAIGLRERFSASRFLPDVLRYGVTWWNYVGEPVHYILQALLREYGTEQRILAEVAGHPGNRLRYALGNGASPPDIDRFMRYLGLDDMFELYGSTEAAISTFRRKEDPRGSVGEITDPAVRILNERGEECPPAELGPDGRILNYHEAVGEICRVAPDTSLFQGYYENEAANAEKYRDGVYHSGDLGHVLLRDGKRYLFFDGRTDDWIRKDGENFSAAQVARLLAEHPDVALAAAYGVPCAVSDELVMAALKLRPGARFDPDGFFEFCRRESTEGSMDPKWFPDFVRIVEEFEYTGTQKILVRHLKRAHFHPDRVGGDPIFFRERGDSTFRPFAREEFERLRKAFHAAEREHLLEP